MPLEQRRRRRAGRRSTVRRAVRRAPSRPPPSAPPSNSRLAPDFARRPGFASARQRRRPASSRREQEDLDQASFRVAAVEARRPDAHVVAHQEVAGREKIRQLRESARARSRRSAVEDEQPARAARPRLLRDPLRGQLVVEEVDAHGGRVVSPHPAAFCSLSPRERVGVRGSAPSPSGRGFG